MANTIKFGNAQWATKKDSILAYNDENANFKPLPFVTSRASTATRVNKAGLLETVASGIPRVDYLSNTSGAYLLEPSSTNLITQSEAFGNSYWTKSGASIEGDASTAGSDLLSGWDFTVGWVAHSGGAVVDANSFNSNGGGYTGIKKNTLVEAGKTYLIQIAGTVASGDFLFGNYNGTSISKQLTGTFNSTFYYTASDAGFLLRNTLANIQTDITTFSAKEVQGFSSPSADTPLGAFKLVEDTSNGQHATWLTGATIVTANTDVTFTAYVKKIDRRYIAVGVANSDSRGAIAQFDLDTQSLVYYGGIGIIYTYVSSDIKSLGNDWYRLEFVCQTTGTSIQSSIALSDDIFTNPSILNSANFYTGNGTSGVYIFGAQLEQSSYATSYIPTAGSAITRLADTASQTVPDGVINSSEGVLYFEGSALADGGTSRYISLSDGSFTNRVSIYYSLSAGIIGSRVVVGGVSVFLNSPSQTQTNNNKIAVKWKLNDYKIYINGVQVASHITGGTFTPSTLSELSFNDAGTGVAYMNANVKDVRVYNTALTDAELVKLTTI